MSIVTIYVCDLTGYRSENLEEFIAVQTTFNQASELRGRTTSLTRHFKLEKAIELGLITAEPAAPSGNTE